MKQLVIILTTVFFTFLSCKKEIQCVEDIDPNCVCYLLYKPVCGCNGITYDNDCFAECSGITDYTEGECP